MTKRVMTDEVQAEMIRLYRDEGMAAPRIGATLHIGSTTVYRYLRRNGIAPTKTEGARRTGNRGDVYKNPPEVEKKLVQDYLAGDSCAVLSERYGYTRTGVAKVVKRYGETTRVRGNTYRSVSDAMGIEIEKRYTSGESASQIASDLGLTYTNVIRLLRALKVYKGPMRRRGDSHPSWKGGRYITPNGYVYVRVSEDSLFWGMALSSGYVAEHRLVMAEYLGRELCDWETIHHMDGNRQNNDITNLALHIGKHGKGARYCCADCGSLRLKPIDLK